MQHPVQIKKMILGVLMGTALSAGAGEQTVRFIGSDGSGKSGSICLPEHWEGGQIPVGKTIGLINPAGNVWAGQPLTAASIRQTGGLIRVRGLALRGGAAGSGHGALYEIDDPNTNYAKYVSLEIFDNPLVLWSAFGEPVCLRLLSGSIETQELRLNSAAAAVIDIQNGILRVGKLTDPSFFEVISIGTSSVLRLAQPHILG